MAATPSHSLTTASHPARTAPFAAAAMLLAAGSALAQPGAPVYQSTFPDCITGTNAFQADEGRFWTVDKGCDIYQIDTYERPTIQEFKTVEGKYASKEYFEYLDIVQARTGLDDQFVYVRIDLYGRDNSTSGGDDIEVGMMERYGFRFSTDPDGRNGVLIVSDQPESKNEPNTKFGNIGLSGYRDTNKDVGGADEDGPTGLDVTKSDNPNEESGMNGYDQVIISDGRLEGGPEVAWVRLNPNDNTVVELALDYKALGFTRDQMESLKYFDVEAIKGGPKDPQNYLWNDKYTKQEAGSPNPGQNGQSEFGTDGLKDIYEVDTVRAIAVGGCEADLDGNGELELFDFLTFVNLFNANDPAADCDPDGVFDLFDFLCFTNQFNAGC
jgi:hypothetical protein